MRDIGKLTVEGKDKNNNKSEGKSVKKKDFSGKDFILGKQSVNPVDSIDK